ncbi:MAG: DUF2934 domain-containing protein [Armatimonadota bacterium]
MATKKTTKKTTKTSTGRSTGASTMTKSRPALADTSRMIEERAYYSYLERGGSHGHDVQDWLRAEKEIRSKIRNN